jgi:hypothetical protein
MTTRHMATPVKIMDPYKYYTKEQYEKYGSMLETAQEIDARIKTHKFENNYNKKMQESYKNAWKERTFQTKQFKKYWHHPSKDGAFSRNEPEFLDD